MATQTEIIETVQRYTARAARMYHLQDADADDVSQQVLTYMLPRQWKPNAFRRAAWLHVQCESQRLKSRSSRDVELLDTHTIDADHGQRVACCELMQQATADRLDRQIIRLLASGRTWEQTADLLHIDTVTIWRRLGNMRERLTEGGEWGNGNSEN